jgi:hypothetical protein
VRWSGSDRNGARSRPDPVRSSASEHGRRYRGGTVVKTDTASDAPGLASVTYALIFYGPADKLAHRCQVGLQATPGEPEL